MGGRACSTARRHGDCPRSKRKLGGNDRSGDGMGHYATSSLFVEPGGIRCLSRTMTGTLRRRLGRLERTILLVCASENEQLQNELQAMSDDDLEHLESFVACGATLANCSVAEKSAVARYEAEIEAAKVSLRRGRPAGRGDFDRCR